MYRPAVRGFIAAAILAGLYVGVVSGISGWQSMVGQLRQYWYFLLFLWFGFGFQVGLYTSLRRLVSAHRSSRSLVAATGTSTTTAMLACCTHYLVGILPILGTSGVIAFVGQYQAEMFWVALSINAVGSLVLLARMQQMHRQLDSVRYGETAV